ncbi:EGFR-like transmembrane domain-containing protein [Portibacter marinus]|uniref:EGFR-like transmembrane domain-containing protein n=1 Tax=Portibacter marinus TaxID=2898660 RepID=UPI001F2CF635|nr:transmembrane domain-containing protein [Portibacter marinus]
MISTFLAQVVLGILAITIVGIILLFILRKRKKKTHFQSKIVNDTSYNIGKIESHEENNSDEKVDEYLERKSKDGAQPFNRGDYEIYND